ncbi:MAG: hypothetical protein WC384_15175 [Prolixibacteraceae bacterium]|jgi:hypothetical protein
MKQNEFKEIAGSLEAKIRKLDSSDDNFQNWILAAINLCASAYNELRDSLEKNGFNSTEEEIHFFKVIKPNVLGGYSGDTDPPCPVMLTPHKDYGSMNLND